MHAEENVIGLKKQQKSVELVKKRMNNVLMLDTTAYKINVLTLDTTASKINVLTLINYLHVPSSGKITCFLFIPNDEERKESTCTAVIMD